MTGSSAAMGASSCAACPEPLRLYPGKKSFEFNHKAIVGPARHQFNLIEGFDLEAQLPTLEGDHSRDGPDSHSRWRGLEMLDAQSGANRGLTRVQLLGNGGNGRRLEPVTEDWRGQHRDARIFETFGEVFGRDRALQLAELTDPYRPHRSVGYFFRFLGRAASSTASVFSFRFGAPA